MDSPPVPLPRTKSPPSAGVRSAQVGRRDAARCQKQVLKPRSRRGRLGKGTACCHPFASRTSGSGLGTRPPMRATKPPPRLFRGRSGKSYTLRPVSKRRSRVGRALLAARLLEGRARQQPCSHAPPRAGAPTLRAEVLDYAVEGRAAVAERPPRRAHALFASAERAEVLGGARHRLGAQLDLQPPHVLGADGYVQVHDRSRAHTSQGRRRRAQAHPQQARAGDDLRGAGTEALQQARSATHARTRAPRDGSARPHHRKGGMVALASGCPRDAACRTAFLAVFLHL